MTDSLTRIACRAAGRLARNGVPLAVTAALILDAFQRTNPAGQPSEKARAMDTNPHACPGGLYVAALWCPECQTHFTDSPGKRCPCCVVAS